MRCCRQTGRGGVVLCPGTLFLKERRPGVTRTAACAEATVGHFATGVCKSVRAEIPRLHCSLRSYFGSRFAWNFPQPCADAGRCGAGRAAPRNDSAGIRSQRANFSIPSISNLRPPVFRQGAAQRQCSCMSNQAWWTRVCRSAAG